MTNQGPWSLMSHGWYDRSRHRQIWQLFSGCFQCCSHLFWCVGTKLWMHIRLLGRRDPYRPYGIHRTQRATKNNIYCRSSNIIHQLNFATSLWDNSNKSHRVLGQLIDPPLNSNCQITERPPQPFPLRFHCTMTNSSVGHPRFCLLFS